MDEVAAAIADPVRREIMVMLRHAPLAAGAIAGHFQISRPAVSRHLRVLRRSGLVSHRLVGRQRIYELNAEQLTELVEWLAQLSQPSSWERHLDALETEVYRTRRERRATDQGTQGREHTA
jgi:DNA-binding transcriptional ArsR family regulator